MRGSRSLLARVAVSLLLAGLPAAAGESVVVKLATMAPDGSLWLQALKKMGDAWNASTQGRVTLRVYPGGIAGDETDMVRKMRIGQIQAASVTAVGLSEIDDDFDVFSIPMFFQSVEEMTATLAKIEPKLRESLEARGFVLIGWGYGGIIHFFTKKPVHTVDDFRKVKMFASAGDDSWVQWWKSNGFRPVALAMTDILTGLQTGMIDGYPTTPLAALSLQWFRQSPYMLDVPLAPLLGATVMPKKVWDRISEPDRAAMLKAAREVEESLLREIPKQEAQAVAEMEKRGLQVIRVADSDRQEWAATADRFAASMRGAMVRAEIFDLAKRERDAWRARGAGRGTP